jgi:hypothetical protein
MEHGCSDTGILRSPKLRSLSTREHTATIQTYLSGEEIREAETSTAMLCRAGGPQRPKLQDIAVHAFREFGVATYATPERAVPGGEMSGLWPYATA